MPKNSVLTQSQADKLIFEVFSQAKFQLDSLVDLTTTDLEPLIKAKFNRSIFNNQVEILKMFFNPTIRLADIICARQSGKSMASRLAVISCAEQNLYPSMEGFTQIGWYANKEEQAVGIGAVGCWRILEENYDRFQHTWDKAGSTKTHLVFKREAGLNTKLMGSIDFKTANPRAFGEGFGYSLMVIDEANRLADITWSEVLLPMGGAHNSKIVKIGVPRLKNHFWKTANDPAYYHIKFDWTQCALYFTSSPCEVVDPITKDAVQYGLYPIQRMPLTLKREFWPDNPILHILPAVGQKEEFKHVWDYHGDMDEDDFRTQYSLEWLTDVMLFLKEEEQKLLFESSNHAMLDRGIPGETYFYGYDPCGEEAIVGIPDRTKKAHGSICVWRKNQDESVQKVFCDEVVSATPLEQVDWVTELCHPETGLFQCIAGAWDATGLGVTHSNEVLRQRKLPILPVVYSKTAPDSAKNMKNVIFENFRMSVDRGKAQYPRTEGYKNENPTFFIHRSEWENVEKKQRAGINADIRAPGDELDDGPNADCLAVYIAENFAKVKGELIGYKQRARVGVLGPALYSRPT